MTGKWLKKIGKAGKKVGKFVDKVTDDLGDKLEDLVDDGPVRSLVRNCQEVATISRETVAICDDTADRRDQMIAFGSEISETLRNFKDAGTLTTIKELTAGAKVAAAMDLAKGLQEIATACVDKSVRMTTLMETAMDAVPDFVKDALQKFADDDDDDDDDEPAPIAATARGLEASATATARGLDQDVDDVTECVEAIQNLNLTTAFTVGTRAFTQLSTSSQTARGMFDKIRAFAKDIKEVADAVQDMNPQAIVKESKDVLRCIFLSEEMRVLSVAAGKLMAVVIKLFSAIADRISVLWSALAYAKDCIADCLQYIGEARDLCHNAKDRGQELVQLCGNVCTKLDDVGDFNQGSINAVRSLTQDGEINKAIDIAMSMDDLVMACTGKVVTMVDRVNEGFANLPPIITDGVVVARAGTGLEKEPEPADVEADIKVVEDSVRDMEGANIISAGKVGVRGFRNVSEKTDVCKLMLEQVVAFTGNCDNVIATFMNVWDLQSAGAKIAEMCNLVNLGKMIKQFAEQIKRLLMAIVTFLKTAFDKFTKRLTDAMDDVGDALDAAKDQIGDKVDALAGKLKFWK
jgi:hypothetical protein